jgi:glycyl-tRNA synthetase
LATPRRLAVIVEDVAPVQAAIQENVKGPGAKVAFDAAGKPTQAAIAFAKRFGLGPEDLTVVDDGKNSYVYARRFEPGKPAADALGGICNTLIGRLTFEKTMRWNASNVSFSRPLQWYVAMLGTHAISFEHADIMSGRLSTGNRGRGSPQFQITSAGEYETILREHHVLADIDERKAEVARQINAVANGIGAVVEPDEDLLDEVANLVEEPNALLCAFEPEFLEMPAIILTKTMSSKQRYFTLNDAKSGAMRPNFITVRNGPAQDAGQVIAGNEDVIRARFADASYFYRRDVKKPLAELLPKLDSLTFQTKLGSMLDKARRIESLVEPVATLLSAEPSLVTAREAARLCKADLVSNMVIEMTSLQGAMGRDYLLKQGGDASVAQAIAEHYTPRFAGDKVPASDAGLIVSIADRLDSIAGLFAVGLAPKGSADPFALRRAAQGIVQGLVSRMREFSLRAGLKAAAVRLPVQASSEAVEGAHKFIVERQRAGLLESGLRHDVVDAVLAVHADDPHRTATQAEQLARAVQEPDWPQLLAAYSRCARIAKGQVSGSAGMDTEPASVALADALDRVQQPPDADSLKSTLRQLRGPIDHFFDKVLVNAEDAGLRAARLALVLRVVRLADGVCDPSRLDGF